MWIELPWPENPANTCTWHKETLDSYSTLLGLISSVYRDLPHTGDRTSDHRMQSCNSTTEPSTHITHKRPQNAEPKLYHWTNGPHSTQANTECRAESLPMTHRPTSHTSDHKMQSRNSNTEPPTHIAHKRCQIN